MSSSMCKGRSVEVSLADLRLLPEPQALGSRHKPIHPATVIEQVQTAIEKCGHHTSKLSLAINPKRTRLISTLDVEPNDELAKEGRSWSIGLLSAIDKSTALKLSAGSRIFVCDNLMCTGDIVQIKHKHTTGFNIVEEIFGMVERVVGMCKDQDAQIATQMSCSLTRDEALWLVGEALVSELLPAARVRHAADMWCKEEYEDVRPRTVLGLHNAFTRSVQELKPYQQLPRAIAIGRFFDQAAAHAIDAEIL